MEFERAIFRVYERCMEGLRDDPETNGNANAKSCTLLQVLALGFGGFLLFVLICLHIAFVGSPGCLHQEMLKAVGRNSSGMLGSDEILYITIDSRYRPEKDLSTDDATSSQSASILPQGWGSLTILEQPWLQQTNSDSYRAYPISQSSEWKFLATKGKKHAGKEQKDQNDSTPIVPDPMEPEYDYKFTLNSGLLMLPYSEIVKHKFNTVNVTLLGSQCYGSAFTQSILPIGGVDTVIVNALMYTFKQPGHVFTGTGDYFRWSYEDLYPYSSIAEWVQFKLQILFYSLLAFFFLTTITALMVRILISSGVVLIFPIFWLLQLVGCSGPLNLRVVAISYPWIGVPLEMIRARNQPITPFIIAHMSRVVVYYFLYQATQIVFAVFFYNRDSPGQQELWIFGVMMLWEYFAMIYVRAKGSIILFPRAALAMFLMYHFYYFSFPAGFHVLALVVMFFMLVGVMVHCIRVYELKDYERGFVSLDQPRALYNSLPFPVWNGDLAPEYTLMMPVTNLAVGAYQAPVPALNPGAGAGAGGGGTGAATGTAAGAPNAGAGGGAAAVNPLHQTPSGAHAGGGPAPMSSPSANIAGAQQPHTATRSGGYDEESGGIELGRAPGGVLGSMLGGSGGSRTAAYSRLENQDSSHGAGDGNV